MAANQQNFSNIEVDISNEQVAIILEHWIRAKLNPASVDLFRDQLSSGLSVEEATLNAVINDSLVFALETEIERQKLETPNNIVD